MKSKLVIFNYIGKGQAANFDEQTFTEHLYSYV